MFHYLDKENKPCGPHSLEELKILEINGVISKETLVAAPGSQKWRPFEEVLFAGNSRNREGQENTTVLAGALLIDSINRGFENSLNWIFNKIPSRKDEVKEFFFKLGSHFNYIIQIGIILAGFVIAIVTVIAGLKFNISTLVVLAILPIPIFYVFQYIVGMFSRANLEFLNGPPIRLYSTVVVRSFIVLGILAFLGVTLLGCYSVFIDMRESIAEGLVSLFNIFGLLFLIFYACWVAVRSEQILNLQIVSAETQNAADYFANLVRLIGRFLLSLVPPAAALACGGLIFGMGIFGVELIAYSVEEFTDPFDMFAGYFGLTLFSIFLGLIFVLPIVSHFIYITFVTFSEIVSAFFRLTHNSENFKK